MPSVVDPVGSSPNAGAQNYVVRYVKLDGTPGDVQAPPEFSVEPAGALGITAFPSTEQGVFKVQFSHTGFEGPTTVTCGQVDGDVGGGVRPIGPFTDTIEARGAVPGVESGTFGPDGEQTAPV